MQLFEILWPSQNIWISRFWYKSLWTFKNENLPLRIPTFWQYLNLMTGLFRNYTLTWKCIYSYLFKASIPVISVWQQTDVPSPQETSPSQPEIYRQWIRNGTNNLKMVSKADYSLHTDKRTDGCSRPLCIYTQIPLKF